MYSRFWFVSPSATSTIFRTSGAYFSTPSISSGAIEAPRAFCFLSGVASSVGLSSGEGVGAGSGDSEADGDALGLGSGVGELFFFFPFGVADATGEVSGFGVTSGSSSAFELDFELSFFGVALGSCDGRPRFGVAEGDGDAFGFAVGVGVGEGLDFFVVEIFRFFGVGVGVGSKIFLILSPNDSAALA